MQTTPEILCQGLPKQFEEFVKYIKAMTFEQEPDYFYLKNLFINALISLGGKMDYCYDWDNRINDLNTLFDNTNINLTPAQYNFTPNNEKVFYDDNILKNSYKNQVEFVVQNRIYTRDEINDSNIEPYPIDTIELNEINMMIQKNNMTFNQDNKILKEAGCQCCLIY